ncbi:MAG: DNA-binding response regulator [Terricaulis sp.]
MIAPLRKQTRDGKPYARVPEVEVALRNLVTLPRDQLAIQCAITSRNDRDYVPTECLLYFVRACRADNSDANFKVLYRLLAERVMRRLPRPQAADGKTASLTSAVIQEKVFDGFISLLALDRTSYCEKLDFFEVRFDGALANLRRDAQEQAWRHEKRSVQLIDEESGEVAATVEEAAGDYNPFDDSELVNNDYRSRLDAAIDALPQEQIRIVEMLRQGFPIDSKDPNAITIARTLGKAEKTIRTHRDKAFVALRAALTRGEES